MGIGYAATFQLSFAQLGITFAISLFFIFNITKKSFVNNNDNFIRSLFITFIIGLISVFIYVLSSYFYLQYSNNRPNTFETIEYGLDFVYSSIGFVLLSSLEAYLFLLISKRKTWTVISIFVIRSIIILLLCYLLGIVANLKAVGIGLSLTIGILISTISVFIYEIIHYRFKIFHRIRLFPKEEHIFKHIAQESISGISLSLAKGLAILCLNLLMTAKLESYIPLSYQMSRVIWFNIMYAIPWLGIGLSDAIKYNDLYNVNNRLLAPKNVLMKGYWILFIISMVFATIFAIGGYFLVEPLASLYIRNSHFNGIIPPMEGLPSALETLINENPPPTDFPPITKGETFAQYLKKLIDDPEWRSWIDKIIDNRHDLSFREWLQVFTNFKSFGQWFINYVSSTSYNADVIKALIIYKTPAEMHNITTPLLFAFLNSNFDAKAYIYICIYGILCSGWSVLLPSSAIIEDEQFPPVLLSIIYFVAVGFIISFGATFSISNIATELGNNNPFRYLDAWTFPIAIVAIIVFIVVFTKWSVACKKEMNHIKHNQQVKQFISSLTE